MIKRLNNTESINYTNVDNFGPNVRRITAENPSPFTLFGTGTYIIGKKEICIIDPGPIIYSHIKNILNFLDKELINHILITHTHADHSPAAELLKKETNAKTYGFGPFDKGSNSAEFDEGHDIKFKPDIKLKDGDIIKGIDWTIKSYHTPGHTSNHMCFGLENESFLFTGDHVMAWATTVIVPPDGNMKHYINSLRKLLKLNYNVYFPTHGSPIEEPLKYVRALIAHRKMREKQIIEQLKIESFCIKDVIPKFYSSTKKVLWKAAEKSVLATLLSLEEDGYVFRKRKNNLNDIWSLTEKEYSRKK